MRRVWTVAALVLALGVSGQAAQRGPTLDDVLDRATAWVETFVDRFANVVAEETYHQEMTTPRRKRDIKAEFLLVRFQGVTSWRMFRDVFEVDGRSVRDPEQQGRMLKLFTEPTDNPTRRATDIMTAGSKYNLRDIGALNHPLMALAFLQRDYRPRLRFNLAGSPKNLGPGVRTVRFVEWKSPTILRAGANSDLAVNGLLHIEEATGRVVKTELRFGPQRLPPEVVTLYRLDETLGIEVPAEMRDWYPDGAGEVRGVATYGRFRRFQVATDERVDGPR